MWTCVIVGLFLLQIWRARGSSQIDPPSTKEEKAIFKMPSFIGVNITLASKTTSLGAENESSSLPDVLYTTFFSNTNHSFIKASTPGTSW